MTSQNKKSEVKAMTISEAKNLLKNLTPDQERELLMILVSLQNLDDKVKALEKTLNIKLKD